MRNPPLISKTRLALLILFLLLLFVRVYRFPSWLGFDYDQEMNAKIAKEIVVDHKLTLIGPETSIGGMYVGPLYNYIISFFFFLGHMNPESALALNLLVSLGTALLFYHLAKSFFPSEAAGLFAVTVYAFSQTMIEFDRVAWNPTPMPLVSLGLIYFLLRYFSERANWQLLLAAVFVGVSFHLHFTAIFLLIFFFLALVLFGSKKFWTSWLSVLTVSAVLTLFLLPLLWFDLRHGFLISRHLGEFLESGRGQMSINSSAFSALRVPIIFVEFFRAIFVKEPGFLPNGLAAFLLLGLILGSALSLLKRAPMVIKLTGLFFLVYLLGLSLYHGALPAHYFLPVFTVFIVLYAGFLLTLWEKNDLGKCLVLIIFASFVLINLPPVLTTDNGLSLRRKKQAVDFIVAKAQNHTFRVEFITAPGRKTGFNYLFWLGKQELIEDNRAKTEQVYKIVVPYFLVSPKELTATFGGVGVIKNEL